MYRFILLISLFFGVFTFSQRKVKSPPPTISPTIVSAEKYREFEFYDVDSLLQNKVSTLNKVYPKKMDASFKNKYKGDEYDYKLTKPKKSFWERLKNRLSNLLESIFGKMNFKYNSSLLILILKILGIILGGFLLFFILRFFFDKSRRNIFGKKNVHLDIETEKLNENIHEINFPETILNFELKKDYRSAVRYQFLYLLKKLNAKNIIVWNSEKTNRDYEIEIKTKSVQKKYAQFSSVFEWVWYGEFEIDDKKYQKIKNEFETVKF